MNKRTLAVLLGILAFAFLLPAPVAAQGILVGDSVPRGTVLDQDVVLTGQRVILDGTVNGNVFILGNQVLVNGTVNGSLILIGQNAGIAGEVSGSVYAAALTLDLAQDSSLERDLYLVTLNLDAGKDSLIQRDLYAVAALGAGLNGRIGRDLHTAIGPVQLYNGLMTLLGFEELTLDLHLQVPPSDAGGASSWVPPTRHARLQLHEGRPPFDWGGWALALLRSWAVLFVFALLVSWLARRLLHRSGEPLLEHPWRALGSGLLVVVITFALFGVLGLLAAAVFAIGLGLNSLGLWQVSLAFWLAAYAALVLAAVALWFFITFATKIIALYSLAHFATTRLFHRRALWLELLSLLVLTILYALLRSIPTLGWLFAILLTAAGAGAAWLAWRETRPEKPGSVVEAAPLAAPKKPARPLPAAGKPTKKAKLRK